ncbi:MAG: TonB-dependent siderophore receptor [Veillonellaceae bacterium]|nr:TonB-dependent siderophore receptor [Veillonellaceae bacterium]
MKKQLLLAALAVACGMQTNWAAMQAEPMYSLEGVIVTDVRDVGILPGGYADLNSTVGILGDTNVMKVPFSQMNYTSKLMETFGASGQPIDTVLRTNPSIRSSGSVWHSDFTIRGIRSNGTSMFLNGIPGMFTQFQLPTHFTDRVEVTSGPAGGFMATGTQYESNAGGGIVNFVSKRAPGEDVRRLTVQHIGRGHWANYLDLSHRFGEDQEWGVRINTEWVNGEMSVKNENYKASSIYVNVDRQTENSTTNFLAGYRDMKLTNGHRWFKLSKDYEAQFPAGQTPTLLKPPAGDSDLSFPGNEKWTLGYIFALNHDQKLNDKVTVFLNAGTNHNNLSRNVSGWASAFEIDDTAGNYKIRIMDGLNRMDSSYLGVGVRADVKTGAVKHNLVFLHDHSWRNRGGTWPGSTPYTKDTPPVGQGNIYNGIISFNPLESNPKEMKTATQRMWGFSLVDRMEIGQWQVMLGGHYHKATTTSISKGKYTQSVTTDGWSPTFGLVYSLNDNSSVYGSYSEYFNEGEIVGSSYQNAGQVFAPIKTKQIEFGGKYYKDGLLLTAAYFDIKMPEKRFERLVGDSANTQFMDGEQRMKGVEFGVQGKLTDKLSAFGGVTYMDAKFTKNTAKELNGKRLFAQPYWSGSMGLSYQPSDRTNAFIRANYTGDSIIRTQGAKREIIVPSYWVWDIGVRHSLFIGGQKATLGVTVYNLFDKDYWMASRGDQVYASLPRTLMLSAQWDF